MPDKLTLKIMDNIVKNCSQYENKTININNRTINGNTHLDENQVKSLEDIIHKRSSVKTEAKSSSKVVGKLSLDDLVNSSKKR